VTGDDDRQVVIWGTGAGDCWNRPFPISPGRRQDGDAGSVSAGDSLRPISSVNQHHT
jgi:hypothetical protein